MTFYVLLLAWITSEFFNVLFFASYTQISKLPLLLFSHSFFKAMGGLEQIWLILELTLRLSQVEHFDIKQR